MSREIQFWFRLTLMTFGPFAMFVGLFQCARWAGADSRTLYALSLLVVIGSVSVFLLGLKWHHRWWMRSGQRAYERRETDRMARTMTIEQLTEAALEGRFPYKSDKDWDS